YSSRTESLTMPSPFPWAAKFAAPAGPGDTSSVDIRNPGPNPVWIPGNGIDTGPLWIDQQTGEVVSYDPDFVPPPGPAPARPPDGGRPVRRNPPGQPMLPPPDPPSPTVPGAPIRPTYVPNNWIPVEIRPGRWVWYPPGHTPPSLVPPPGTPSDFEPTEVW